MQRDDNCLLIYGQRARVGVPGATKYGLTKDEMDAVKTAFENREDNKEKKKTVLINLVAYEARASTPYLFNQN